MASLFFLRSALRPHWLITVLLLGLTGCESEPGSRREAMAMDGSPSVKPPTPEMTASAAFLAGELDVETVLNRTGFSGKPGGSEGGPRGGRGGGGGERGRGRRGGGGPPGMSEGGMGRGGDNDGPTPNIHASNEPPVSFHLRLTNHGTSPLTVEVLDFNSDLGNFVVQPAKILVPPGKSVEAEPMISRLGVRASEIPLTIRLRAGGKTEQQVLTLRLIETKPTEPTSAPSPAPATS